MFESEPMSLCLGQEIHHKYQDQPQQTFTIHKANYPAANGLFHAVTACGAAPTGAS